MIVTHTRSGQLVTHGGTGTGYVAHGCRCEECTEANARKIKRRREARKAKAIPATVKHGLESTYVNWACRCAPCANAHREATAKALEDRRRRTATGRIPESVVHGRAAYIDWGCRCDVCTEGNTAYQAAKRAQKVTASAPRNK